ncbi:hypothetical protein B0T10DRAFT_315880 [Thelonectria olida]|uniref:Uncharacterized protein n=1 Tax=Thelonectria olida TaxID=1576542 RepID=A0A9P8W4T4_9HYPO|nr:hypothetical protein B0T10DRAFT_315880 [Thelonectria olida]
MESISQVAAAAAKAVWGEDTTHKEPVSGVQGDVSKGEPYDAGNLATPQQERVEENLEGRSNDESTKISALTQNTSSVPQKATRESEFLPLAPEENTSSSQYKQEKTSLPGSTENTSSFSRENESPPQSTGENTKFGSYETGSFEKTPQDTSKLRDDTTTTDFANKSSNLGEGLEGERFDSRPSEKLDSRPSEKLDSRPSEKLDSRSSEKLDSRPSEKLDSRSSENLESGSFTSHPEATAFGNDTSNSRRTHVPEPESLESKGKKNENEEESQGTGQEYVRSSGFAADGGDFDATKPGAGREADRLWEEKGNHPDEQGSHGGHGSKDKPSLGHRLKEKLHLGKE